MQYLRRKGDESGRVFPWTPALAAKKDDFELCEGPTTAKAPVMEVPPTRFLRRKGDESGRVFAYTPALAAKTEDFEEVTPAAVTAINDSKPVEETEVKPPEPEIEPGLNDANKEQLIIAAITVLGPDDFTADTPASPSRPRTDVLSKKLGFKVTAAERDSAYKEYLAGLEESPE